jgi:thiamine-phosphate pyrophosphorylase
MLRRLSTAVAALTAKTRKKNRVRGGPWLWVMSDAQRLPDVACEMASPVPGLSVIIRHPDAGMRAELAARALRARRWAFMRILISTDWRTAAALRCDGVHMPESQAGTIPAGLRLWRKAKHRILTTSAHGWAGLKNAKRIKADLVFLSPVLPTSSHAQRKSLGRLRFAAMSRQARVPVAAMGGIDLETLRSLNGARICAVAGIGFAKKNLSFAPKNGLPVFGKSDATTNR